MTKKRKNASRSNSPRMRGNSPSVKRMEKGEGSSNNRKIPISEVPTGNLEKAHEVDITQTRESVVNSKYKYDDYDMQQFLGIYADIAQGKTSIKTKALIPITAEQLSVALEGDENHTIPRNVLIACNLGGKHWVGIGIKVTNKKIVTVEYMDSVSKDHIPEEVSDQLRSYYGSSIKIQSANRLMQSDSVSCGPLTLENLLSFALEEKPKEQTLPSEESVIPFRKKQLVDMALLDDKFANKQLHNHSIVASSDISDRYIEQLSFENYTHAEIEQITKIVEEFNKIENINHKSRIIEVFSDTSIKDHKEYYNNIRTYFYELIQNTELSDRDHAGIDGMLQIMFGKNLNEAKQLSDATFKELSSHIMSYGSLVKLFKEIVQTKDLEIINSELKKNINAAKGRLNQVTDIFYITLPIYKDIVRTIQSSDTWYEKISVEKVLLIINALTIITSATMQEIDNIGIQIAGKAISWFGVIVSLGITIPQTKTETDFFKDFQNNLKDIQAALEEFPGVPAMLAKQFNPEELKKNLNWQRGIASMGIVSVLTGILLNLTYDKYYSKIFSMVGAGLASTLALITSVHHIGKINTRSKKLKSVAENIAELKIRTLQNDLAQKNKLIEEKDTLIGELRRSLSENKNKSTTDSTTYDKKVANEERQAPIKESSYRVARGTANSTGDIPSRLLETKKPQFK